MKRLRWQQVKKKKKSIGAGASRTDLTSDQSVTRARVVNLSPACRAARGSDETGLGEIRPPFQCSSSSDRFWHQSGRFPEDISTHRTFTNTVFLTRPPL